MNQPLYIRKRIMPLSKKKDRDRKRIERVIQPKSNLNPVQPAHSIEGLIIEGNRIVGVQPKQVGIVEAVQPIDAISPSVQREGYGKISVLVPWPGQPPNCPDGRYRDLGVAFNPQPKPVKGKSRRMS